MEALGARAARSRLGKVVKAPAGLGKAGKDLGDSLLSLSAVQTYNGIHCMSSHQVVHKVLHRPTATLAHQQRGCFMVSSRSNDAACMVLGDCAQAKRIQRQDDVSGFRPRAP